MYDALEKKKKTETLHNQNGICFISHAQISKKVSISSWINRYPAYTDTNDIEAADIHGFEMKRTS